MASRDLTNFRQVTQQVIKEPNQILTATAEIGEALLRQNEEAKIANGISKAQLELSALESQYRIDFEGNPMEGLPQYKEQRQAIFDSIGGNISPLYRRDWQDKTRQIATRSDATQQAWVLKQTRVNTIDSVNDTMMNNFKQASADGKSFGVSDESEIEAFVNYGTSMQNLQEFASKNLGSETAENMLETYEADYLKSFVSGVSEVNPHKALELANTPKVEDSFLDPEQLSSFKRSLEARVKRFDSAKKQKAKMNELAQTNALIQEKNQMGYADLQKRLDIANAGPNARAFFEEVNGYAMQKGKLDAGEKADLKGKFYSNMAQIIGKDNLTDNDIELLQESVYTGMRKNALTKTEGFGLLNSLLTPVIDKKAKLADEFETGEYNPFRENLGLETLDKEINQITGYDNLEKYVTGAKKGEIKSPDSKFNYNKNKNYLYDVYLQTLNEEASKRKVSVANLDSLSYDEEEQVYNKALNNAKKSFMAKQFPNASEEIRNDTINTVIVPIPSYNNGFNPDADLDSMSAEELEVYIKNASEALK